MKTLQLYVLRQVAAALALAVGSLTFVLVLGNALREILELLVSRHVSPLLLGKAVLLLIPFVAVFALPIGLLTATLLVFGRLSADQELTAARAGGVSLLTLVAPVLLLSLLLTSLTGWFYFEISPRSRVAYKKLLYEVGLRSPEALLVDNQFIKIFPGYIVYIGKARGRELEDVVIYRMRTNRLDAAEGAAPDRAGPRPARVLATITARKADYAVDETNRLVTVRMPEAEVLYIDSWQWATVEDSVLELPLPAQRQRGVRPKISEMTWSQLLAAYRENKALGLDVSPIVFQIHRQASFAFACVGFALLGAPLGVRSRRRETSIAVAIGLALTLLYYAFFVLAEAWKHSPQLHPQWVVWIPNLLFQGAGAWLLWRADHRV